MVVVAAEGGGDAMLLDAAAAVAGVVGDDGDNHWCHHDLECYWHLQDQQDSMHPSGQRLS